VLAGCFSETGEKFQKLIFLVDFGRKKMSYYEDFEDRFYYHDSDGETVYCDSGDSGDDYCKSDSEVEVKCKNDCVCFKCKFGRLMSEPYKVKYHQVDVSSFPLKWITCEEHEIDHSKPVFECLFIKDDCCNICETIAEVADEEMRRDIIAMRSIEK
jgi:hypothetical protein